jgi:small GTP-binding protein
MSDFLFKVCIFGDGGVGKTTLINRYLTGLFEVGSKMTIGVDFRLKRLDLDGNTVTLQLWDLAGEERFRSLMPGYVSGADGGLFMYDVTRVSSLKNMKNWLDTMKEISEPKERDIPLLMVGGKLDLAEKRAFPKIDAEYIASVNKFKGLIECSAKTGENVEEIFVKIAQLMLTIND